ncbi:ARM repeat-containing protein [Rhizopus microsporus var. microsporus]|uniref:ARM repeat-containing protein n=1 Tax=Rhizopus microsporus var. microsporus TaxID=86635 RepID=A0A1X0QRX3_RHIZD|nr:ARM repeat-containing protein [Rhizopus microsporus var. microsporus]
MSASRQSPEEIVNRLPELLRGISQRPVQQRIQLLHVILPILRKWNMDPAEQTMAREQQFQFNTSDVSVILGFFLDVMLYQPLTARDLQEGNLKQPGLSKQAIEDVTNKGKVEWTMTKLKDAKLGIIHFVLTPIFTDSERLPLLIAGACDSNQQVSSTCEDGMRKWIGSVDYEDKKTIQTLYRLYLGTKDEKDPRLQASTPIKIRVLQYLTKSVAAANMNTHMIQSTEANLSPVAPIIVSGLLKFINQNEELKGHDGESIRGSAYVACGLVAKKVPQVALSDNQILSLFFNKLEQEERNVRSYVQDALSSMIEIYVDISETVPIYKDLQNILLEAVQKNNAYSRYMALKYANAIYPFSSVFARYICLLGFSNSVTKLEVKEECSRGLTPFVRSKVTGIAESVDVVPPTELPKFSELIEYVYAQRPSQDYVLMSKSPTIRGYPTEVFSEMLGFIRMICVLESNPTTIVIDNYVSDKVDNSMSEDPTVMNNFKTSINEMWSNERQTIEHWLELIQAGLSPDLRDPVLLANSAKCLLEIISLGPSSLSTAFNDRLGFFKSLCLSEKLEVRALTSHIFGIIVSNASITDIETILNELYGLVENEAQKDQALAHRHGAVLAIGYTIGRCQYRRRELPSDLVRKSVTSLASLLQGTPGSTFSMLANAACQALTEIGRTLKLNQDVVDRLIHLVKSSKDAKVQERSVLALGHLAVPMKGHPSVVDSIINCLLSTADSKQVEIAFATGEALSILAFGWKSQAMQKYKDVSDMPILDAFEPLDYDLQDTIDKIIRSYVASDRSWYRKAACIWLLSILKFGKDQNLVTANLQVIHASFSRLLSDRDEFTQECASKGLGLVYEYGDSKLKEDMLYSLVGAFTEGRRIQAQSVTDNTVLFEEGALGETPDGNSITTYKELCSLASEMNQPDLIYKFMNLANHNAMWTSRKGAAFGFQNLMALAEKEMEPYLPRLIPKLYRYQFDPNPRVNQTMKSIWRSVVKDNQKTIDAYFNQIMEDLLAGLGNHQWRVREASCSALNDLVQGRKLGQIEPFLEQLWQMSFRALDDIKDSVRQAATQTCKTLTKLTVHYCDPTTVAVSDGEKVMGIVMPFLLHKGIVSDAEDIQKFSLDAVLRVSLEPQAMNYLSFHVEKYNISQEQLDNARLSGAKNSPMMEGIEHCIHQIDEQVMEELTPRILHIVRKGTGLPTKAGCARFIVTLVMNRRTTFTPYADQYLKALSGTIRSKNPVIRKSYATAIGYVCQVATYDRLISIVKHLKKLYIEDEDEDAKAGSAVTVVEMTRFATDRVNSIASNVVPLVFFGEHDPEEDFNKLWKAAWENLTSGTRSMVSLYANEILDFTQPLLSSSSWKIKQTAALTIADMCKTSESDVRSYAEKLLPVMISTLATRSWAGKEYVLDAFAQLCISIKDGLCTGNAFPPLSEIAIIFVREAKRRNRTYQRHALVSLTKFMDTFGEHISMFDMVNEFLTELCQMDETEAVEDEDSDNAKPLILMIKANAFRSIVSAYRPKAFAVQEKEAAPLCDMLTGCLSGNIWNVQLSILQSLKTFVKHCTDSSLRDTHIRQKVLKACFDSLEDKKYSAIRTAGVELLEQLSECTTFEGDMKTELVENIHTAIQNEPVAFIRETLQKVNLSIQNK